jgi:ligand-binding sensor domain-containing protein
VPSQQRFKDSYLKFGVIPAQAQVLDILLLQDSIWVATDQGVAVADLRTPNLQDPAAWKAYTSNDGLLSNYVTSIAFFNGKLYAGTNRGVSVLASPGWSDAFPEAGDALISRMRVNETILYIMTKRRLLQSANGSTATPIGDSLSADRYPDVPSFSSIASGPGLMLGSSRGIVTPSSTWVFEKPNGPNANVFQSLNVDARGRVWACSGNQNRGMYVLDGDVWTSYSQATIPQLKVNDVQVAIPGPADDVWFGTWGGGIVHMKADNTFEQFDNSSVPGIPGYSQYPNYAIIPGIAMDAAGTMWFVHRQSNSSTILSCRKTDGTWKFFATQYPEIAYPKTLAVDGIGNKWFLSQENFSGAIVFNDNGTFENASDDRWYKLDPATFLATGAGVSGAIQAVTVDRIGDAWVGTTLGPRVVWNSRTPDVVSRTCYVQNCNIEGQSIKCIAVDPVNNKWLGSEKSGVFVLSPDGGTLLAQYTTDNSPLVDNSVTSIAIHPITGVAYIGTNKGLSALTTPYVRAVVSASELRVSPNPFHPGIDEHVVIDGLAEGSTIKVLSASGNLIREIPTPGGRIGYWDGKNADGDYAATGIYFVVSGTAEGAQTAIGKLAVVRK